LVGVSRLGGAGLSFLLTVALARLLGPGEYGVYAVSVAWVMLLSVPVCLGADPLLVREIARRWAGDVTHGQAGAVVRWAVVRTLAVSLLTIAGVAAVVGVGSWSGRDGGVLLIVVFALPAIGLAQIAQSALRGSERVVVGTALGQVFWPTLMFAGLGVWLLFDWERAAGYAAGLFAAAWAICAVVGLAWLGRQLLSAVLRRSPQADALDSLWRPALSFVLMSGMALLNLRIDLLMVDAFEGKTASGVYAFASSFAMLVVLGQSTASTVYGPRFATLAAEGRHEALRRAYRVATILGLVSASLATLLYAVAGSSLLSLAGEDYTPGYGALLVLAAAQLIGASFGPVRMLLAMTDAERTILAAMASSIGANAAANLMLIPQLGMVGAAVGTLVGLLVWNGWLAAAVWRRFGILPLGLAGGVR